MNREDMLKGFFDTEERQMFAHVLDLAQAARKRREVMFSGFMDVAKCARFQERLKAIRDLTIIAYGGTDTCERAMLGIGPDEISFEQNSFPICVLRIAKRNKKFGQSDLNHRDYLGSILGLGIERSKVGDILLSEEEAVCFVQKDIAPYIMESLEKISKTYVSVEKMDGVEIEVVKKTENRRITVPSLRLDAILSEVFRISRGKVQTLIKSEKAQANWMVITNASHNIKTGDMISLRGYGRFRVGEVFGKTKKDRIVVEVEVHI